MLLLKASGVPFHRKSACTHHSDKMRCSHCGKCKIYFPLQIPDVSGYEPGQALNVEDLFKVGDVVDIAGTSIGKGFQGMRCAAWTAYTPRRQT